MSSVSVSREKSVRLNRSIVIVVFGALIVLMGVLFFKRREVSRKIDYYTAQYEQIQEEIREEEDRSKDLEKLPAYLESYEYIEKVAREIFHLVYEDEILIQVQ